MVCDLCGTESIRRCTSPGTTTSTDVATCTITIGTGRFLLVSSSRAVSLIFRVLRLRAMIVEIVVTGLSSKVHAFTRSFFTEVPLTWTDFKHLRV